MSSESDGINANNGDRSVLIGKNDDDNDALCLSDIRFEWSVGRFIYWYDDVRGLIQFKRDDGRRILY